MMENIRKAGIITKGIVYSIVGILTLLAALNLGGSVAGKNKVIDFIQNQTFGQVLLIIVGIGLAMYSLWRIFSAFKDPKDEGSNKKGVAKRIAYFVSGLVYGALAVSIFTSSSSSSSNKESAAQMLMQQDGGIIALYIIGIILFFVGVYQFYKGVSLKFLKDIENMGSIESKSVLEKTGKYGHMARGVAFALFAFFVFVAASQNNAEAIKGLEGMFTYLQDFQWGNILMGLMALGLLFYGVYQYFLARYSSIYS